MLARILPKLRSAADERRAALSAGDLAAIQALMDGFSAEARPELRRTIEELRAELRSGRLFSSLGIEVSDSP